VFPMPKHSLFRHANYFEAIIQLRPAQEDMLKYVHKQILKRKDVTISRQDVLKTGMDIYISSRKFAMALGKKLKKAFPNGTLTLSRTLHSQDPQSGKKRYRVTVLYRLKQEPL
jgi:NMD protein affecting ribosome stability and mRNA decay